MLVLAIAGLIFLMVFVALPALQRSQRDTARRNDMSRVDTSLVQYQTNHNTSTNNLPGGRTSSSWTGTTGEISCSTTTTNEACEFVRDYMNSGSGEVKNNELVDPSGEAYSMVIVKNIADAEDLTGISNGIGTSKIAYNSSKNGLTIQDNSGQAFDAHVVYIVPGARCNDDTAIKSTTRHHAVLYRLEGAGTYCINDQ